MLSWEDTEGCKQADFADLHSPTIEWRLGAPHNHEGIIGGEGQYCLSDAAKDIGFKSPSSDASEVAQNFQ